MLLVGIKENNGWVLSRWNLTYSVGWEHICKSVHSVYDFYTQQEVLLENQIVTVIKKDDILTLPERGGLTIRGNSNIIKVPIMITFYNQTNIVDVNVAKLTDEFAVTDYEKFNKSLCQYLDSIELAMYR
ncbi:MAG: hypothetical protein IJA29_02820 [Lachnospiraceae bacterium]|nr:hypothetical protein [Lachnospiraceae bacterium]